MRFAICNETFVDWPLERAFAKAAELGYTGIEIAPFTMDPDVRRIGRGRRLEVVESAARNGLEIVGLHWLFAHTTGFHLTSPDVTVQANTIAYFQALIECNFDLGGRILVLGSPKQRNLLPGVTRKEGRGALERILTAVLPTLEQTGCVIALEPLGPEEGDFLRTAAEAREIIEDLGSPHVKLHLDVKAMSTESIAIPDLIRANRDLLVHFHANDPNRRGPGMGDVPFAPILAALAGIDYRGWVSVEVFDYAVGPERLAHESIQNLKGIKYTNFH